MMPPPIQLARAVISRVKVMSHLDIAETRLPQDGRIELNIAGNPDTANPQFQAGAIDKVGKTTAEMTLANLKLSYDFADYTLVSVSSWYQGEYFSRHACGGSVSSGRLGYRASKID